MKILYGVLILTFALSYTNGIPIKQQLLCNSNYMPFWSGNHIMIGDILRRIKQTRRCALVKNDNSETENPIKPTHIGIKHFEGPPLKDPNLETKKKKKVCQKIFRPMPMPRMYYNRMQYGHEMKCHWIEVDVEEITSSTMSITPTPPIPKTNSLEITDFFLRG